MVLTALMVPVLFPGAKAAHAPRKSCKIVTRTIKKCCIYRKTKTVPERIKCQGKKRKKIQQGINGDFRQSIKRQHHLPPPFRNISNRNVK